LAHCSVSDLEGHAAHQCVNDLRQDKQRENDEDLVNLTIYKEVVSFQSLFFK